MKRQTQDVGIKKWWGDYFVDMQDQIYTVLDRLFSQYGNCVIEGCETTGTAGNWSISEGLVGIIHADGFRVGRLEAQSVTGLTEVHFEMEKITHDGEYKDGGIRPIAFEYKANRVLNASANTLTIKLDGSHNIYQDLVQKKAYELAESREPKIETKYSGFNLPKSDSIDSKDSNELATSKAVGDLNEVKEPKIETKESGFNLPKSDSVDSNESSQLATSKAVKAAYDKIYYKSEKLKLNSTVQPDTYITIDLERIGRVVHCRVIGNESKGLFGNIVYSGLPVGYRPSRYQRVRGYLPNASGWGYDASTSAPMSIWPDGHIDGGWADGDTFPKEGDFMVTWMV
ncbi:tail fiber protein [Persicobacter sp. CCB-QB2]|uniref:tail fiber protein n=1 Tax=Persicobacter sp. CCB-QB2 TaxID=1561025 RepID=UPI0006A9E6A1|nr:tail fiber protein [Persicobacter sp. CCB-QB2]